MRKHFLIGTVVIAVFLLLFTVSCSSNNENTKQSSGSDKQGSEKAEDLSEQTEMAKAAEAAGTDAISLINTITGMKIDINRRTFALANKTGGMSGPAIKPVAVRMVYQAAHAVKIPIIGMGGISTAEDAIEFILAGATAVSVGAANFINPYATIEVIEGIEDYMRRNNVEDIKELIGAVKE